MDDIGYIKAALKRKRKLGNAGDLLAVLEEASRMKNADTSAEDKFLDDLLDEVMGED